MKRPRSRKDLAVMLSKLEVFTDPNPRLEQYPTDCNVAAQMLWVLHLDGALEDVTVADLGCGTGILGLGALLLGAKKVYFVDVDAKALEVAQNQFKDLGNDFGTAEFNSMNVTDFSADDIELVLMNPPFGAQQAHADKVFLEKAFALSEVVVSFHKTSTMQFLEAIASDYKYDIVHKMEFDFPLKKTMEHHTKKIKRIDVVACFFVKRDRE